MGERLYSSNPADRAKDILNHYFELIFNKVGLNYDSDTKAELDQIVDEIIEAGKPDEATESMQQYYLHKARMDSNHD